jgi:Rha family phage regulatory protein
MKPQEKIVTLRKKQVTTTSLIVAEKFNKLHKNVLSAIRNLHCSEEFARLNFKPIDFIDKNGDTQPAVEMTRDGFMFLAMGFTGKEAGVWKERFIGAFNHYEEVANDPNRANAIKHKRAAHNPMMDAVIFAHDLAGIEPPSKMDFISENLLCNMAVTGNWAAAKEVELDSYELKMLEAIRYHNGILVQHNISIADRVMKLKAYAENYRKKHPHLKLLK